MSYDHITECHHGIPGAMNCGACKAEEMFHSEVERTLAERGARYGDFFDHAEIAQAIQDEMRRTKGWEGLTSIQKQALSVIADKIARILSGDPNYSDNWHDIQGYAKLVEDRLPK